MTSIRLFFITCIISFLSVAVYSQSVDERISNAMNSSAWRDLRSLYLSEGENLQTPFLHPLSKFFIYHFYNQPDSAVHYGSILLNEYQQELGESAASVIYFMSDDYVRLGDYHNAAGILHVLNEALEKAGQELNPNFVSFEKQYQAMAGYGKSTVTKPAYDVKLPLRYHKNDRKDPVMIFVTAELNGVKYDVNYDTGAGVNVISPELADKIGAYIPDMEGVSVTGIQDQSTRFAIVDSIKLGDIIYRNVPFQVIDFATGNVEADAKLRELDLQCVLGSQMMLPLGEIRFDFADRTLIVPAVQTPKPDFAPNMYRSESNMLILSIYDKKSNEIIDANLDTGGALSILTSRYYNRYKSHYEGVLPNDSVRMAGIGGVATTTKVFSTRWDYEVGGTDASMDSINVNMDTDIDAADYDCLFGLPSLMQHDLVTINFKDMWVKLSPMTMLLRKE